MDRTDTLFIIVAIAALAFSVTVFGFLATFVISTFWAAYTVVAGLVAVRDTYTDTSD